MRTSRRENISTVPGFQVSRQRSRSILTPREVKNEMTARGKLTPTELDRVLSDDQAYALERWAANEQTLAGKAKTQDWSGDGRGSLDPNNFGLIHDSRMMALRSHGEIKKSLSDFELEILSAFTAIQNRHEGALSPAQYGFALCDARGNKRDAFLNELAGVAGRLVNLRY